MLIEEFIDAVLFRLTKGAPQASAGVYAPAIAAASKEALQRLSRRIAMSADTTMRSSLQKSWSLTLVAGEVAIPADLETAGISKQVARLNGDTVQVEYLPEYRDLLDMPPIEGLTCFTAHEDKFKVKERSGGVSQDPAATDFTLKGSYVPTLAQVTYPSDVAELLINITLEMIQENPMQVEQEGEAV